MIIYILLAAWVLNGQPRVEVVATFNNMKSCREAAYAMGRLSQSGKHSCVPATETWKPRGKS